jgi:dihydrofolate synthase/folylpolyglutamate synthase
VAPAADTGAFRLQRMRHLLRLIDHPQNAAPIVHVGGTKGKGSTCHMVAAILSASGRRTGLYTSPHIERLEERFRVDGQPCTPEELEGLVDAVRGAAEAVEALGEGPPTFFELTTAMAMEHFRRRQCDVAVIEVGLGGRLDSTNVCDPAVSVLTSVGLDHQHILGDTIEKIAREKAGIIKPGVPVISGFEQPEAREVVRRAARLRGAPLWQLGADFLLRHRGAEFDVLPRHPAITPRDGWSVRLLGAHQQHNAALALVALDVLGRIGLGASLADQRRGLEEVECPGRIERFSEAPEILLDTAHNVDSIKALGEVLRNQPAAGKCIVVFGTSADKDAQAMLDCLGGVADLLILTRYWSNPRWLDPASLQNMSAMENTHVLEHPQAALEQALRWAAPDDRIVICGSFFLAAELRPLLRQRDTR